MKALPFQALLWIDETKIIAAGYDCVPMLVANQGAGWCGLYARRGHLRALPYPSLSTRACVRWGKGTTGARRYSVVAWRALRLCRTVWFAHRCEPRSLDNNVAASKPAGGLGQRKSVFEQFENQVSRRTHV